MNTTALISVKEHVRLLRASLEEQARYHEALIAHLLAVAHELADVWVEQRGARLFTRRLERMDHVVLEVYRGSCDGAWHDPAEVRATPCATLAGTEIRYVKDYRVATMVRSQLFANETWEEEMRGDRVPERVIEACRRALTGGSSPPSA